MYTDTHQKNQIIKRLKIAQGHLNKVTKMFEKDTYCIDILHQTGAIESALKKIDQLILQNHLNSCVIDSIKTGKSEEVIAEIMNVYKRGRK